MKYATSEIGKAVKTLLQKSHSWGKKWQVGGSIRPPAFPHGRISAYFAKDGSTLGEQGANTVIRLDLFARTDAEVNDATAEVNDLIDGQALTLENDHVNWCSKHEGAANVRGEYAQGDSWWRATMQFRIHTQYQP